MRELLPIWRCGMLIDRLVVRMSGWASRWDEWRFRERRADYYDYLADMIQALSGHKTLRDLFDDDAERFGGGTARGRLARQWGTLFEASGGNLAMTWETSFPADEVRVLRAAQCAGAGALALGLRDLARAVRTIDDAKGAVFATLASAIAALCLACLMLAALPLYTAPRLFAIFQAVPLSYYGNLTRAFFRLAHGLSTWGVFVALAVALVAAAAGASFSRLHGRARRLLDHLPLWSMYRDFHAIRFLSLLTISLRRQGSLDTRLHEALALQAEDASPWLGTHLQEMVERVGRGAEPADALHTGMIDRETWWYLSDLVAARGVAQAMGPVRDRVEGRLLTRVKRHALYLRWLLLGVSVGMLIGLALWHYAVIDELRRAMMQFFSSR